MYVRTQIYIRIIYFPANRLEKKKKNILINGFGKSDAILKNLVTIQIFHSVKMSLKMNHCFYLFFFLFFLRSIHLQTLSQKHIQFDNFIRFLAETYRIRVYYLWVFLNKCMNYRVRYNKPKRTPNHWCKIRNEVIKLYFTYISMHAFLRDGKRGNTQQ